MPFHDDLKSSHDISSCRVTFPMLLLHAYLKIDESITITLISLFFHMLCVKNK